MTATEKMVKVTYASRTANVTITKNLFGYKGWQTKSGTKTYRHKPIVGLLHGIPFQKLGRATIVLPLDYLPKARAAIAGAGGVIKSVDPIAVDWEGNKKETLNMFHDFLGRLVENIRYAAEAPTKDLYDSAFDKSISLTKRFESYMSKFDEYGSVEADGQLLSTLLGLKSLSGQDFEAAKLQAAFFVGDLEKRQSQILK
ncbi:MAG: hypothetical protein OK455_11320 [Thaumarchaeota archaeon]|nr:hypothetical protein [Nitrososphaerota archaeon]